MTFVEAVDGLMPGFDPEIGKMAQRILINPRKIDYHTGVLAKKVHQPCTRTDTWVFTYLDLWTLEFSACLLERGYFLVQCMAVSGPVNEEEG